MTVDPIPEGFNTITPTLVLSDAAKAIDLYVKAFGAKEDYRMPCPNTGKIMHACLTIGSSKLFLCDEFPGMTSGVSQSSFYLYMKDVDAAFSKATQAGLKEKSPVTDQFWGDRTGCAVDPFGVMWTIATHKRNPSSEEMAEAVKKFSQKAA